MADHIFICYAREDQDFVLKLADSLRERGVSNWIDQRDIPAGVDWDIAIEKALFGCTTFLIVLSPQSINSKEVRGELRTALDKNKNILPLVYQECEIPRQLRLVQYIDFTVCDPDDNEKLEEIIQALNEKHLSADHTGIEIDGTWIGWSYNYTDIVEGKRIKGKRVLESIQKLVLEQSETNVEGTLTVYFKGEPYEHKVQGSIIREEFLMYECHATKPYRRQDSVAMLFIHPNGNKMNGYFVVTGNPANVGKYPKYTDFSLPSAIEFPLPEWTETFPPEWVGYVAMERKLEDVSDDLLEMVSRQLFEIYQ